MGWQLADARPPTSLSVADKRGTKHWLNGFSYRNQRSRRPWSLWAMLGPCRLPQLALWTVTVILVLYVLLECTIPDTSSMRNEMSDESSVAHQHRTGSLAKIAFEAGQGSSTKHSRISARSSSPRELPESSKLTVAAQAYSAQQQFSTPTPPMGNQSTLELPMGQVRRGRVFILIIEDESHFSKKYGRDRKSIMGSRRANVKDNLRTSDGMLVLPAHIEVLVSILDAHGINYSIGSTRFGLPTALLMDRENTSDNLQFSVIVMDDFVKYTRLNRWLRDQLDRLCRAHSIGVVAYLTPGAMLYPPTAAQTMMTRRQRRRDTAPVAEDALANQFPLAFRAITHKSCTKAATSCLVDYQVNDKSPILRIVKRRADFVLAGPLEQNLNQSPWVAMSSDHITYEPLTWARLSPELAPKRVAGERAKRSAIRGTQQTDQHEQHQQQQGQQGKSPTLVATSNTTDASLFDDHKNLSDNAMNNDEPHSYSYDLNPASYRAADAYNIDGTNSSAQAELRVLSMYDRGLFDGIKRVIFGGANHHWLNRVLLLDAIEHLSAGNILSPLERFIQIDIDDIFVGEQGKRMRPADVEALVETQAQLARMIPDGFKFNLGFSGKYYKHGSAEENAGDQELVRRAQHFHWFCHTWGHTKAHLCEQAQAIGAELQRNLEFARQHGLPIIGHDPRRPQARDQAGRLAATYAVAPHHSGVYPVHEQLYEAWSAVLNVQVTSTEEYPHLRPASARRAFVHKAIKVLPRQTCGLYTHTIYSHKYPGGIERLWASVRGGELFETLLHNPVNIYMTHMSNYAHDRLAASTFVALLDFVQANTNLQLRYAPTLGPGQLGPASLAHYYFRLHPDQAEPLWTDKQRALCPIVPRLLIVGPQKTGTTALYSFLKMNPALRSSAVEPELDFEEIQFFNDKHYLKGVDWYLARFQQPAPPSSSEPQTTTTTTTGLDVGDTLPTTSKPDVVAQDLLYFDKSATYFDDPKAPRRAAELLPDARIIIMLINPADRAYSWYQHARAHGEPAALALTFEQVISAGPNEWPAAHNLTGRALRSRCLQPGYYSNHLAAWLDHFPARQLIVVDGHWFRLNPASVLHKLQLLLRLQRRLDYDQWLVFDPHKGFHCQRLARHAHKCLGEGKGRKYPAMGHEARAQLNRHYWPHNRQLARLLTEIGQPLPGWLEAAVSAHSAGHQSSSVMY